MQIKPNTEGIQTGLRSGTTNTIVYMGAGNCSELNALLAQQPQRLLLIEADPQLASDLQARTATHKQVRVQNIAVSDQAGPATFYRYNLPDAGSLRRPSGLLELYPGLKIVEELQIKAESAVTLLQPLQLAAEQENLLIVDLPGEEFTVLQALQQAGQLQLFRQLQLHCGRQPLYLDSKPAAQILQWLRGQGFDVVTEDDTQNPDSPCWGLQRNSLYLRNRELEHQLQLVNQVRAEQAKLAADRQIQIQQLTRARDEQAKLAAERQIQIQQVTQARDEQTKLAADRQIQIQQLTQARDEQAKLATERQRQLDERQKRLQQIEALNTEFVTRQSLLQEEVVRAEAQIDLIKDVLLREPGL